MLTPSHVTSYEGTSIADICPHGFDAAHDNHCAHFVAHVLQLDFGMTCTRLRGVRGATGGANVRVQEIFARCPSTEEVRECPTTGRGLVFVSGRSNFQGEPTRVRNVPKKHIGIVVDGQVWHYSNARNRVVRQPATSLIHLYPRQDNALWWGTFPRETRPTFFGQSA